MVLVPGGYFDFSPSSWENSLPQSPFIPFIPLSYSFGCDL